MPEFIPYQQALELKELGFDELCLKYQWIDEIQSNFMAHTCRPNAFHTQKYWSENDELYTISIPTYSQVFRWFREKHKIISVIDFYCDGDDWENVVYEVRISEFEHFKTHDSFVKSEYKTYEEAELACLKKLIEIVKNK